MTGSVRDSDLDRDIDLENTVGCLLVIESQVDKLRHRLARYPSTESSFAFNHNGKLYSVSVNVDVIRHEDKILGEDDDQDFFTELGLDMP
jgi:hypothetical protein